MFMATMPTSYGSNDPHIEELALEQGCTCTVAKIAEGPDAGRECYVFRSRDYGIVANLLTEIIGTDLDEEFLKTAILEV